MRDRTSVRYSTSRSDNRKSKTENSKWFGLALCALLFALYSVTEAQQPKKIPRIGSLEITSPSGRAHLWDAFRQGLHDLGYVEGKNIAFEQRWAHGRSERLPELAAELVQLKVDMIVTASTPPALAAKQATSTIPIVMASQSDPVGTGLVTSLARPGGNITGLSSMNVELGGKRLELLKEAFPKVSRVTYLMGSLGVSPQSKEIEVASRKLGIQLQLLRTRGADDFENAFSTMAKDGVDAFIVAAGPNYFAGRRQLGELAAKSRLPAMYPQSEYVDAGGLMAYGIIHADLFRRAATYVDKILKGAKPADLPVEQPTRFELVINLKTAKQIGLAIPPNVLARADKVIR